MARRIIEQAYERQDGALILLALDWAKAFDSLSPDGLLRCLMRFGVPQHFRDVIAVICENRQFFVRYSGVDSNWHP